MADRIGEEPACQKMSKLNCLFYLLHLLYYRRVYYARQRNFSENSDKTCTQSTKLLVTINVYLHDTQIVKTDCLIYKFSYNITLIHRFIRSVAYKWIVRWLCGYMGWDNRRPLPSCIYHHIRTSYSTVHLQSRGYRQQ